MELTEANVAFSRAEYGNQQNPSVHRVISADRVERHFHQQLEFRLSGIFSEATA